MAATGAVADWQLAASAVINGNGKNWVGCGQSAIGPRSSKAVIAVMARIGSEAAAQFQFPDTWRYLAVMAVADLPLVRHTLRCLFATTPNPDNVEP